MCFGLFSWFGWKWLRFYALRMRIAIFAGVFVDYLVICLRSLGHFPTGRKTSFLDYFGYLLACLFVTIVNFELWLMYKDTQTPLEEEEDEKEQKDDKTKSQKPAEDKQEDKKEDKELKERLEFYYEGMEEEALKDSWIARKFNFFYLLRLYLFCLLLVNFQYLQVLQILISIVNNLAIIVMIVYGQSQKKIFKGRLKYLTLISQEVCLLSMTIIVGLLFINSHRPFIGVKFRTVMSFIFIGLFVFCIFLEIVGAIFDIVMSVVEFFKKEDGKKKNKTSPLDDGELPRSLAKGGSEDQNRLAKGKIEKPNMLRIGDEIVEVKGKDPIEKKVLSIDIPGDENQSLRSKKRKGALSPLKRIRDNKIKFKKTVKKEKKADGNKKDNADKQKRKGRKTKDKKVRQDGKKKSVMKKKSRDSRRD